MPAAQGSEADASRSLQKRHGVLVGVGNPETWQGIREPGSMWLWVFPVVQP